MSEVGYGIDQLEGYEGVVLHAGLDRREDAEVLTVHCTHYRWIELHGLICFVESAGECFVLW